MAQGWTPRIWAIADTVIWILKLNAWWWLGAVAGLLLFGVAPATATGAILVRRRSRGEQVGFVDAVRCYRAEFVPANLSLTPAVVLLVILISNLEWFAAGTALAPKLITAAALSFFATACCFLGPLYAGYHLPRSRYLLRAITLTLAKPLWAVLMFVITAATVFAASKIIILIPFLAVGFWLHTTSRHAGIRSVSTGRPCSLSRNDDQVPSWKNPRSSTLPSADNGAKSA